MHDPTVIARQVEAETWSDVFRVLAVAHSQGEQSRPVVLALWKRCEERMHFLGMEPSALNANGALLKLGLAREEECIRTVLTYGPHEEE